MTKLEQLITEYCPNGVPYKSLGELGSFYGGLSGKSKDDFTDGNAKFITYMNVYSNPTLNLDVTETVNNGETSFICYISENAKAEGIDVSKIKNDFKIF